MARNGSYERGLLGGVLLDMFLDPPAVPALPCQANYDLRHLLYASLVLAPGFGRGLSGFCCYSFLAEAGTSDGKAVEIAVSIGEVHVAMQCSLFQNYPGQYYNCLYTSKQNLN